MALTFEVGVDRDRCFVKWLPSSHATELDDEARRLDWAARFTSVPTVIDAGRDDDGAWLVTSPVQGENAVSPRWKHDRATAVRAIGEGLRPARHPPGRRLPLLVVGG